jgi:hypothetical protein
MQSFLATTTIMPSALHEAQQIGLHPGMPNEAALFPHAQAFLFRSLGAMPSALHLLQWVTLPSKPYSAVSVLHCLHRMELRFVMPSVLHSLQ